MARSSPTIAPAGWGSDRLTAYLDNYRDNQFATFANKPKPVSDLIAIDRVFVDALEGQIDLKPFLPAGFFLRAHSAFRAAGGAIMAGQTYETQTLLRLCLEHGGYAIHIGDDIQRWERWMRRQDSDENRKAVRQEFAHGNVARSISSKAKKVGEIYVALYERLIDFGAHPNEHGYSINTKVRKGPNETHFDTIYLQGDGIALDAGLRTTAQVGIWVLQAIQLTYPTRFQLLQLRERLDALSARY